MLTYYTNSCSHHQGQNVSFHLWSGDFDPPWTRNYHRLSAQVVATVDVVASVENTFIFTGYVHISACTFHRHLYLDTNPNSPLLHYHYWRIPTLCC